MKTKEPGQPGYDPVVFQGFALRVGINLARKVGWGDGLESALSSRFPTAPADMIQQLRGVLQQGNFAAQQLHGTITANRADSIASADSGPGSASGATDAFNLDAIPIVPATFAPEAAGNRIIITGDAISEGPDGEPVDENYLIFGGNEDMDYEEVLDEAIEQLYENRNDSPKPSDPGVVERVINWITRFVGRLFI